MPEDKIAETLAEDAVYEGELYGEEWEDYKAHIDSQPEDLSWLEDLPF